MDRKRSIIFLLCCNNEIGVVSSLTLKEVAHAVDSEMTGKMKLVVWK